MTSRIAVALAVALNLSLASAQAQVAPPEVAVEVLLPSTPEAEMEAEVGATGDVEPPAATIAAPCQESGECPSEAFSWTIGTSVTVTGDDLLLTGVSRFSIGFSKWIQLELMVAAGGFPDPVSPRADVIDLLLGGGLRTEFADIDRAARFYAAAGVAVLSQNRTSDEGNGVTAAFHAGVGVMVGWPVSARQRIGFYVEARGQLRLETVYSATQPGLELAAGLVLM